MSKGTSGRSSSKYRTEGGHYRPGYDRRECDARIFGSNFIGFWAGAVPATGSSGARPVKEVNVMDSVRTRIPNLLQEVILPDPGHLPVPVGAAGGPVELADSVQNLAAEPGLGIQPLGWAPLFEERRLVRGEYTDWEIRPLLEGELVEIPEKAAIALSALENSGVRFDRFYWAEELEKPELRHPISPWTMSEVVKAGCTVAILPLALLSQLAEAFAMMDPALIGVVAHPEDPQLGFFVLIAKWNH